MLEYTPTSLADELVNAATVTNPQKVADFCAGNGSLLRAASKLWPEAKLHAVDVDTEVAGSLPNANWICADFLDASLNDFFSRAFAGGFDLILLNPPFSSEGAQVACARGLHGDKKSSVAFAFLFTALQYLESNGQLLAIMPTSSLYSERDAHFRKLLNVEFECDIVSPPTYARFPGLDVSTYLIKVKRRDAACMNISHSKPTLEISKNCIVKRGQVSIKRADRVEHRGLHTWIHTTSIRCSKIISRYRFPETTNTKEYPFLRRGSLVLPRVGKVKPTDLLVTTRREVLSDCLFGVEFLNGVCAYDLFEFIKSDFHRFREIYAGTGAPYTTKSKVELYIDHAISQISSIEGDVSLRGDVIIQRCVR